MTKYQAIVKNINDPEKSGKVQIDINGITTDFLEIDLPWAIVCHSPQMALNDKIGFSHHNLRVGSQVLVEQTDNFQTWFVTHSIPSKNDHQIIENVDDFIFTHPSGIVFTMGNNKYTIVDPSGATFNYNKDTLELSGFKNVIIHDDLQCKKTVNVDGATSLKSTLDVTGSSSMKASVDITGPVTAQALVTAQAVISQTTLTDSSGSVLLKTHTHSAVTPGISNTGPAT